MRIGYFFPLLDPSVLYSLILFAFGSLLVTIVLGFAHDSYGQTGLHQVSVMGR